MFNLEPQAIAAIVGGSVVGLFALASQIIVQVGMALGRRHDAKRRDLEWFRQNLLDTYGHCLKELYRVVDAGHPDDEEKRLDRDLGDCQRYLLQLATYCTDEKTRKALKLASSHLTNIWDRGNISQTAQQTADKVRDLMWSDARIQPKEQ